MSGIHERMHRNARYTLRDTIHGSMELTNFEFIKKIIDDPIFQRLRHIKQMGLVELVYPGATHNRFSHCLGVAHLANRMINSLKDRHIDLENKNEKAEKESWETARRYAVIAGLLHDIGHGPFSHTFEKILEHPNDKSQSIRHEDWTERFVKEFEAALDSEDIDYKVIVALIKKDYNTGSKYKLAIPNLLEDKIYFVQDIVSSQIDADRFDYIKRDATQCGVPFGNFDMDWLILNLELIELNNHKRLCINDKSWQAAEDYLLSRRMIYQNIAYHKAIVVFDILLIEFLKLVGEEFLERENNNYDRQLPDGVSKGLFKFLVNAARYRNGQYNSKADFIHDNFNYYKILYDSDIWNLLRSYADKPMSVDRKKNNLTDISSLAKSILQRQHHKTFSLKINTSEKITEYLLNIFKRGKLEKIEYLVKKIRTDFLLPDYKIFVTNKPIVVYNDGELEKLNILHRFSNTYNSILEYSKILSSRSGDLVEQKFSVAISRDITEDDQLFNEIINRLRDYVHIDNNENN